jgi:hypothetical protein
LPRPLAVVAAAVQVREDKKRERNKKRQIRRRVKGKEEALTAAAAGLAERGEKEKEVSVAAVVATTVRKKKPTEKKSSEAQFEESLTSRLLELSHLSTEDKEFILSMLDKLISAFIKRGEKEKKDESKEADVAAAAAEKAEKTKEVEVAVVAEEEKELKKEAEVTVAIAAAAAEATVAAEEAATAASTEAAAILFDVTGEVERLKLEVETLKGGGAIVPEHVWNNTICRVGDLEKGDRKNLIRLARLDEFLKNVDDERVKSANELDAKLYKLEDAFEEGAAEQEKQKQQHEQLACKLDDQFKQHEHFYRRLCQLESTQRHY